MKKLIVLGIVAVMVMGMSVAASAYVFGGSAKSLDGTNYMTALQFGDSADSKSAQPSPTSGTVELALPTNQTWDPGEDTGALNYKFLAKTDAVNVTTGWTIMLWGNNYASSDGMARVRFWIASAGNGGTLGSIVEGGWQLTDGAGNVLWTGLVDPLKKNETTPWIDLTLAVHNTATPNVDATKLVLGAVPEPGSMVALFSGLVGLVGYGIRRRK